MTSPAISRMHASNVSISFCVRATSLEALKFFRPASGHYRQLKLDEFAQPSIGGLLCHAVNIMKAAADDGKTRRRVLLASAYAGRANVSGARSPGSVCPTSRYSA